MAEPVRVVLAEDDVLLREGIARILMEAGLEVVGQAGDADTLLRTATALRPDVVVTDIQMPPTFTDDGVRAAAEVRRRNPGTAVLVLSQYFEEDFAAELIGEDAGGVGYLLKERVGDVEDFVDAVHRVAGGGSAIDPVIVSRLLGRRHTAGPLDGLSDREREVLALMAEGQSNRGISERLFVSEATIEKHVTSIFTKLSLGRAPTEHRRVLAVLAHLRAS